MGSSRVCSLIAPRAVMLCTMTTDTWWGCYKQIQMRCSQSREMLHVGAEPYTSPNPKNPPAIYPPGCFSSPLRVP